MALVAAAELKFLFQWIMGGKEWKICLYTGSGGRLAFLGDIGEWTQPHGCWEATPNGTIILWFRFNYKQGVREELRMATVWRHGVTDYFQGKDYEMREVSMIPICASVGDRAVTGLTGPENRREIIQAVLGNPSRFLPSVEDLQFGWSLPDREV